MKKILPIVLLFTIVPSIVFATSANEIAENEMSQNENINYEATTNESNSLHEMDQMLKEYENMFPEVLQEQANTFIYTILAVIAVSMIFENILKYQRDKVQEIKDEVGKTDDPELIKMEKEAIGKKRKIMLLTMSIYLICFVTFYFVSRIMLGFDNQITGALLFVSFVVVVCSTFFKIRIFKKKKR